MAAVLPADAEDSSGNPLSRMLWQRRLPHYPDTGPRYVQLGIVVLVTVVLYYQAYIAGAVSPSIIAYYGMTFPYYVYIGVAANALGAFASLLAGVADRWGRANLVVWGLGITSLLTLFAIPNAPDKTTFAVLSALVGVIEGVVLVATPALVRDYSPQLGRASAMGFWTLGPVVGSLVVSGVSSATVEALPRWQAQFVICGIVSMVVFVIAAVGLRELSPAIRDQIMVSLQDRALLEARAAGIDPDKAVEKPFRQVLTVPIVGSALAISLFLIIYYTAVGFFTVYFTTIFGYTLAQANSVGNWFWGFDALALIVAGVVSDRLGVRKPFMLLGAIGAIVMTIVFLNAGPQTSYSTIVLIISTQAAFLAIAYAPWMASFTETVERRNPALIATGLAVWGWIIRIVVAVSIFILPLVVSSMTPLVQYGERVATLAAQYDEELQTISVVDPATLGALTADPTDPGAGAAAVAQISQALSVDAPTAAARLQAVGAVPAEDLAYLQQHGPEVEQAAAETPGQWRTWFWVCVAAQVAFIPFIFLMSGRWSPRRARRDVEEHERRVAAELEKITTEARLSTTTRPATD